MAYLNGNEVFIAASLSPSSSEKQAIYDEAYAEGKQIGYDEGCEKGKQSEYDRFWDTFQQNGSRDYYYYAFNGNYWVDDIYNPKYPIVCKGGTYGNNVFYYNTKITDIKVPIIFDGALPTAAFYRCYKLKRIPSVTFIGITAYKSTFSGCTDLEEINISEESSIDANISFVDSTKLTHDSLMSIINALCNNAESINLRPYADGQKTDDNGLFWSFIYEDDIVYVNGTSGSLDTAYYIVKAKEDDSGIPTIDVLYLEAGTYKFSLNSDIDLKIDIYAGGSLIGHSNGEDITFTLDQYTGITELYVYPSAFQEFNDVSFKPTLTKLEEVRTCTLGTTNLAKLTNVEISIATEKGWTLA